MKRILFCAISSVILLASSFLYDHWQTQHHSVDAVTREIISNLTKQLSELSLEAKRISADTTFYWPSLSNHFYLVKDSRIVKWSRNDLPVKPFELLAIEDLSFVKMAKHTVVVRKWKLSGHALLIGIIPISSEHRIVNQYLQPWLNEKIIPGKVKIIDSNGDANICLGGKCLFSIEVTTNPENLISFWIAISGLLFLLMAILGVVHRLHFHKQYFKAFVILFTSLALMRIAMVQFSFPSRWIISDYINPIYFASSSFNSSLIDFVLNSLIVAVSCGYLFLIHSRLSLHRWLWAETGFWRIIASSVFLLCAFFSFLFPYLFVEAIFHDSRIVFDLSENVDFTAMRLLLLTAVMLGCASAFFFLHIWVRWAMNLTETASRFLLSLLIALVIFVGYSFFSDHQYIITISLGCMYILYLYYSGIYKSFYSFGFKSIPYLLTPVILFSLQIALANKHFSEERKIQSMQRFASNTLDRDELGEYLLNNLAQEISKDPFIQSSMSNPLLSKHFVRDKIREKYLTSYFDRYHFQIALFKSDGVPADALTNADLASAVKSYVSTANQTQYKDIYFVRGTQKESLIHYLAVVKLSPEAGFIFLDLSLKRVIPNLTLPELVVDNRFAQAYGSKDFSFAFYKNDSLMGSFGSFNFARRLSFSTTSQIGQQLIHQSGYTLLSIPDENSRRTIVVSLSYSWFMVLANFSFFFIIGVSLIFILMSGFLLSEWRRGVGISYTARIQSFAYLAFLLPLVVVSFMALRMINQSNQNQILENNIERGNAIGSEVSEMMSDSTSTDVSIRNYVMETARTMSLDLNVYNSEGDVIASSSPEVIDEGLISTKVNREAWEKIIRMHLNSCLLPGRIGKLDYASLFFPIKSTLTGKAIGILELPFIRSDLFIAKSKVNVMANILVIFAGVFILFAILTSMSINSFTWPFRLMAKTLKSTRIGGNELLTWNSSDEIGLMVKEYNQMVVNLERSKQALEKSERENAWREIAQQVAHEIKNPLTPIKLTLQQLDQSLPGGVEPEKVSKSVKMLLTQVEVLNNIATAFSSFAKLPSPNLQEVEVEHIVKEVLSLYKNQANRKAEVTEPFSCKVKADPKLLAGVISNLILNAFQSRPETEEVSVAVHFKKLTNSCVLSFTDNGSGIPDDLKNKIFVPHFSTKQSGSGLGLAIAKQALESMGGKIWFESVKGRGSVFFLELQLSGGH